MTLLLVSVVGLVDAAQAQNYPYSGRFPRPVDQQYGNYPQGYSREYAEDYNRGFRQGRSDGLTDGRRDGAREVKQEKLRTYSTRRNPTMGEMAFADGYNNGYREGYEIGFDQEFSKGLQEQTQRGYKDGYNAGLKDGRNAIDRNQWDESLRRSARPVTNLRNKFQKAYDDAFERGYREGFEKGYRERPADSGKDFQRGYVDGYKLGFQDGQQAARSGRNRDDAFRT
ncbi:MAG TPA: hypothetical protein PLB18_06215, partial [Acidobacteriota bacterium]|nr:hypothetical protein [Acidobacteriota bacterium]